MLTRVLIGGATIALLASGCGRNGVVDSAGPGLVGPTDTASTAPSLRSTGLATTAARQVNVMMQDACDPDTFNAVLGAGACLRNGGVTFQDFIAQLTKHGSAGAWFFAPRVANVHVGDTFVVRNNGGEEHTFTEVEEFGGGIVDQLNMLAGVPDKAPECLALEDDDRVPPGGVYTEPIEDTGHEKYQCCIHPWMRTVVHIAEK
jgi:plastocyanin